MPDDVAMENDGEGHTHTWERNGGACVCGEPVPTWLQAAWTRYDQKQNTLDGTA